jgi:hypothetical protein
LGGVEVVGHEVPDQQAVVTEEQGVVVPAGVAQGDEHLRPHGGVPAAVLVQAIRPYLKGEADSAHSRPFFGGPFSGARTNRAPGSTVRS